MSKKKKKTLSIAQRAGYARRRLKNSGIKELEDHKGTKVPIKYVPDIDLLEHFFVLEKIEEAKEILKTLQEFKYKVQTEGVELYDQMMKDEGVPIDSRAKNFTHHLFDRTMGIEYKRPKGYVHDEKQLAISREYKKKWLDDEAGNVEEYVLDLIEELMTNSDGDIDPAKKSKLNQLATKIKKKNFKKMVEHYNRSLDAYYKKRYERFLEDDDQGKQVSIILTYATVHPEPPDDADSEYISL